jgi:pimeloyl-ACP methyl ester carboxylesterase
MIRVLLAFVLVSMLFALPGASAQESTVTVVRLEADDGLQLIGDYWTLPANEIGAEGAPVLLLLHGQGSSRTSWQGLIPTLLEAGYQALAIDLRGHGDTGGASNMWLARDDIALWLAWLHEQPGGNPHAIAIVGSSLGSMIGLAGCAASPLCVTVIAISPQDTPVYDMQTILGEQLRERSVLLLAGHRDGPSARAIAQYIPVAQGEIGVWMFDGGQHGLAIFTEYSRARARAVQVILDWLDLHLP